MRTTPAAPIDEARTMHTSDISIEVTNLGPIARGAVSLRPLTVFVGPNNTGKTYFAQVLYSVRKAFENAEPTRDMRFDVTELRNLSDRWALSEGRRSIELPARMQRETVRWVLAALGKGSELLRDRLMAYFAVPDPRHIQRWDQPRELAITASYAVPHSEERVFLSTDNEKISLRSQLGWLYSQKLDMEDLRRPFITRDIERFLRQRDDMGSRETTIRAPYSLRELIWSHLVRHIGLTGNTHYLPAGRSGLLAAWTDVVKLQGERIRDRFGLIEEHSILLGGVALDFITALAQVLGKRRDREYYALRSGSSLRTLRRRLEPAREQLQELMGGEIHTEADRDGIPILEYRVGGHGIPVQRASSMVADLAPLAMWIDNFVRVGDLLIIDEPESHLHPAAVRKLARVLVRLVNAGVNVVCATHSPVLLHEISNCILRQRVSAQNDGRPIVSAHSHLDSIKLADVAVYGFGRADDTLPVTISSIEIDEDWGISEDDFAKVAVAQINESADLHDLLDVGLQ